MVLAASFLRGPMKAILSLGVWNRPWPILELVSMNLSLICSKAFLLVWTKRDWNDKGGNENCVLISTNALLIEHLSDKKQPWCFYHIDQLVIPMFSSSIKVLGKINKYRDWFIKNCKIYLQLENLVFKFAFCDRFWVGIDFSTKN